MSRNTLNLNLLAVRVGEMFIVLAEQKDFETIKTHLIDEEGAEPDNFLYYTAVQRFNLGHSTYGTNLVAEVIPVLFTVGKRRIRDFSLSFIFTRIIGFFLAPALLTNWFTKICYLVEDRSGEYAADPELIKWYENWHRLSNFVYNGGKAEVEDKYLTICSLMPVR